MKIFLSVGHSILKNGTCTSASGFVNEYKYNKELARHVQKELQALGHRCDVIVCPERKFTNTRQEASYKLPIANGGGYDVVCELHLNASNGKGHGTEIFYYRGDNKGKLISDRYCQSMKKLGFRNRGAKHKALYMINSTKPTAVLMEHFFCDNKHDTDLAKNLGYTKIAKAIAYALTGQTPRASEPVKPRKPKCVMYFNDGNKAVAEVISYVLNVPLFKDNGKDLPNNQHSKWDIQYVGNLGKDRKDTCKKALNKYLGTNFK